MSWFRNTIIAARKPSYLLAPADINQHVVLQEKQKQDEYHRQILIKPFAVVLGESRETSAIISSLSFEKQGDVLDHSPLIILAGDGREDPVPAQPRAARAPHANWH